MHRRLLSVVLAALALAALGASSASAAPTWAPAASATIHPGVQVFTDGAQCTANFVFFDAANVYLGQAAHCSGTGSATDTDGCASASLPDRHAGRHHGRRASPGRSSTTRGSRCRASARPTPTRAPSTTSRSSASTRPTSARSTRRSRSGAARPASTRTARVAGDKVLSFGNSELRGGVTALSPKEGASLGDDGNGWSHTVYTVTPGIPGDSGSAFLDRTGQALGVLSTVAIAPRRGQQRRRRHRARARLPHQQHELRRHAGERHRAFPGPAAAGVTATRGG